MDETGQIITAVTAFLSGFGSVITAYLGVRFERKRSRQDFDDRLKAFMDGMKLGQSLEPRDDRRDDVK